jgi:hypothetical protein
VVRDHRACKRGHAVDGAVGDEECAGEVTAPGAIHDIHLDGEAQAAQARVCEKAGCRS